VDRVFRGARVIASSSARPAAHSRGRRCAICECDTILSIYNFSSYCALHETAERSSPRRRARERELFTKTCESEACGLVFETTNVKCRFCSDRCRMLAFAERQRRLVG